MADTQTAAVGCKMREQDCVCRLKSGHTGPHICNGDGEPHEFAAPPVAMSTPTEPEEDEIYEDHECSGCGADAGHYYGCLSQPKLKGED